MDVDQGSASNDNPVAEGRPPPPAELPPLLDTSPSKSATSNVALANGSPLTPANNNAIRYLAVKRKIDESSPLPPQQAKKAKFLGTFPRVDNLEELKKSFAIASESSFDLEVINSTTNGNITTTATAKHHEPDEDVLMADAKPQVNEGNNHQESFNDLGDNRNNQPQPPQREVITINGIPLKEVDDHDPSKYIYDIYVYNEELVNESDGEENGQDEDDEGDSNDENNPANDYPDSEDETDEDDYEDDDSYNGFDADEQLINAQDRLAFVEALQATGRHGILDASDSEDDEDDDDDDEESFDYQAAWNAEADLEDQEEEDEDDFAHHG